MSIVETYHLDDDSIENFCCGEASTVPEKPVFHLVPTVLSPAPYWSATAVVDANLKTLSLKDYMGKYLILLFYPYDFTFVCPTELIQFNDRLEEFQKSGCEVVAISTDSQFSHLAWVLTPRKQGGLGHMQIPMISDKNHQISKEYGVLDEKEGISMKGLFVIDKRQIIKHMSISEQCLARSVDETLRIVEGCIFKEKHGDVCPKLFNVA